MFKRSLHITVCIALIVAQSSALASPWGYDPKGQAEVHAALWTLWRQQTVQCERALKRGTEDGVYKAAEELLTQLVGDQVPDGSNFPPETIQTWRIPGDLSRSARENVARRIYGFQNSFRDSKSNAFSFAHVVRGEGEVREYLKTTQQIYNQAKGEMESAQAEFVESDKQELRRLLTHKLPPGLLTLIGSFGLVSQTDNGLLFFAGMPIALIASLAAGLFPIGTRVLPLLAGGNVDYRERMGDLRVNSRFEPAMQLAQKQLEPEITERNFFAETNFRVSAAAFRSLKRNTDKVSEALKQSCVTFSANSVGQECTAWSKRFGEIDLLNADDAINKELERIADRIDASQKDDILPVTISNAFFRDANGAPVLLSWITVKLSPIDDGQKKVKPQAETERETEWMPGLKPALSPAPARAR